MIPRQQPRLLQAGLAGSSRGMVQMGGQPSAGWGTVLSKVLLDLGLPSVNRPAQRSSLINCVFDIQPCSAFDQQTNNRIVAGQSGLVQWRRVTMVCLRIVSVRILARIE